MSRYDLNSLDLPVLNGSLLKIFAAAFANPVLKSVLKKNLLETGGVNKIRGSQFTEEPTYLPLMKAENPAATAIPLANLEKIIQGDTNKRLNLKVRDYHNAYKEGIITPLEVAERFIESLENSEQLEPPLRAFIAVDRNLLLSQAAESSARWAEGKPISILDGVPVTVKDEIDMAPFPSTVGTTYMGTQPVEHDATVVARLRAAGALLLGKANMHEIGINPDGSNPHYGRTGNPWNLEHDTGGSSSGPCTAVAAGFSPIALGADGGGSIRVPAAHCGLTGLKPTYGRISEFGAAPLGWSFGTLGPIASSVEDLAIAYAAIAGPDEKGPRSLFQPEVSLEGWDADDLDGMKVGIYWEYFNHAEEEIVAANKSLVSAFERLGAEVIEIEIPDLDYMRIAHVITLLSEMATCMTRFPQHLRQVAPSTLINLTLAGEFTSKDYLKSQQIRTRGMKTFKALFEEVDIILTPTTAMAPPFIPETARKGGWSDLGTVTEMMRYMFIANLIGLPAITFPAGFTKHGLPIGMQAIGSHWDEHLLLRIAHVAESIVKCKCPPVFYDLLNHKKEKST